MHSADFGCACAHSWFFEQRSRSQSDKAIYKLWNRLQKDIILFILFSNYSEKASKLWFTCQRKIVFITSYIFAKKIFWVRKALWKNNKNCNLSLAAFCLPLMRNEDSDRRGTLFKLLFLVWWCKTPSTSLSERQSFRIDLHLSVDF